MNNYNNDILFVTAFKDLNRKNWNDYGRSNEFYFQRFYEITKYIKHCLIVFIEKSINDELHKIYNFNNNIIFMDLNIVNTFLKKNIFNEELIIKSEIYKNKIPIQRKNNPEHKYASYNLINHSKINFISKSKELYPNYIFYSWIDFGFGREIIHLPTVINIKKLPKKIIYQLNNDIPKEKICSEFMLSQDVIFFMGSAFIIPNELIEIFEILYEKKLKELEEKNIVDDDQNVVLQIYFDNKDLFSVFQNNTWFVFYKLLNEYYK